MLTVGEPDSLGLDPRRWRAVLDLAGEFCRRDLVPAIALCVGRFGRTTGVHRFGRQRLVEDSPPLRDDAIFLVASITKPVVAMGALVLVERGEISLGDRVCEYLPEFGGSGRYGITVRHLLTHTSGLPDMLPDNLRLRAENAPLAEFVERTCRVRPNFPPGRGVQYQSMGFVLLREIIGRVSGKPCPDFLRDEIFTPLEMRETSLGAPDDWFAGPHPTADRIPEIRVPQEQVGGDHWNWNSRYWRQLGAPWGGLLTTPADLARFAQMMLGHGTLGETRVLSRAAVEAATRNQLEPMRDVPAEDRRCRPWGLGWRLNWPAHSANFGDLLGPGAYGHWGATGTLLWIDPDRHAFAVILTTQPQEPGGPYLARLSNAIAAAIV